MIRIWYQLTETDSDSDMWRLKTFEYPSSAHEWLLCQKDKLCDFLITKGIVELATVVKPWGEEIDEDKG